MEKAIAVSACLLGYNCKYNGENNLSLKTIEYAKGMKIIPICPEVFGGLGTPRIPAEIQSNGRIITSQGNDVTKQFEQGTYDTWELIKQHQCQEVILKDGSPSCGYLSVYDGTFSNKKINGQGVTARFLQEKGIKIIDL